MSAILQEHQVLVLDLNAIVVYQLHYLKQSKFGFDRQ